MVDEKTFNVAVGEAFIEYINERTVLINDSTGNLLRIGDRTFIITCEHVARDYFKNQNKPVVLRSNNKIPKEQLKYIIANKWEDVDIAVIEILGTADIKDTYTMNDFLDVDNFSTFDFSKIIFILSGLPEYLSFQTDHGTYFQHLQFLTLLHETMASTEKSLFLKYPTKTEAIETKTNKRVLLKNPRGLSGSFILAAPKFEPETTLIWQPAQAKVVAVQHRWSEKEAYMHGSNIKYLKELLTYAKII